MTDTIRQEEKKSEKKVDQDQKKSTTTQMLQSLSAESTSTAELTPPPVPLDSSLDGVVTDTLRFLLTSLIKQNKNSSVDDKLLASEFEVTKGFCFSFAVIESAMHAVNKEKWWDAVKEEIIKFARWLNEHGSLTFPELNNYLDAEVTLADAKKTTRRLLFERVINYLLENRASFFAESKTELYRPTSQGKYFKVKTEEKKKEKKDKEETKDEKEKKEQERQRIGGFEISVDGEVVKPAAECTTTVSILELDAYLHMLRSLIGIGGICIMYAAGHAISLTYNKKNNTWTLFNSALPSSASKKTFQNDVDGVNALALEIFNTYETPWVNFQLAILPPLKRKDNKESSDEKWLVERAIGNVDDLREVWSERFSEIAKKFMVQRRDGKLNKAFEKLALNGSLDESEKTLMMQVLFKQILDSKDVTYFNLSLLKKVFESLKKNHGLDKSQFTSLLRFLFTEAIYSDVPSVVELTKTFLTEIFGAIHNDPSFRSIISDPLIQISRFLYGYMVNQNDSAIVELAQALLTQLYSKLDKNNAISDENLMLFLKDMLMKTLSSDSSEESRLGSGLFTYLASHNQDIFLKLTDDEEMRKFLFEYIDKGGTYSNKIYFALHAHARYITQLSLAAYFLTSDLLAIVINSSSEQDNWEKYIADFFCANSLVKQPSPFIKYVRSNDPQELFKKIPPLASSSEIRKMFLMYIKGIEYPQDISEEQRKNIKLFISNLEALEAKSTEQQNTQEGKEAVVEHKQFRNT